MNLEAREGRQTADTAARRRRSKVSGSFREEEQRKREGGRKKGEAVKALSEGGILTKGGEREMTG